MAYGSNNLQDLSMRKRTPASCRGLVVLTKRRFERHNSTATATAATKTAAPTGRNVDWTETSVLTGTMGRNIVMEGGKKDDPHSAPWPEPVAAVDPIKADPSPSIHISTLPPSPPPSTPPVKKPRARKSKTQASSTTSDNGSNASATPALSRRPHHDLQSYLTHLQSANKSPVSSTAIGTLYEYATIDALDRLGISALTRCGRAGDNGVDIAGICRPRLVRSKIKDLKTSSVFQIMENQDPRAADDDAQDENTEFNVIVQCKASEKSVGSLLMREMAGAYFGFVNRMAATTASASTPGANLDQAAAAAATLTSATSTPAPPQTLVLVITAGGRLTVPAFRQLEASQMPMVYMCLDKPKCTSPSSRAGDWYRADAYKLASITQVTPNRLAQELLGKRGLGFRTVRSYVIKKRKGVEPVADA